MSYGKYVALVLVVIAFFAVLYLIGRMGVFYRLRANMPQRLLVPSADADLSFDVLSMAVAKLDKAFALAVGRAVLCIACGTACALGVLFL